MHSSKASAEQQQLIIEVAKILGCFKRGKIADNCRKDLAKAVSELRISSQNPAENDQCLGSDSAKICRAADNLLSALQKAHLQSRNVIAAHWALDHKPPLADEQLESFFDPLIEDLSLLSKYSRQYIPATKRGRPADMGKFMTVAYARDLFRKYRHERPTATAGNDFEALCQHIWQLAGGAVDQHFQRNIRWFARFPELFPPLI